MKISTLVDTNVLVDVLKPEDADMRAWSLAALDASRGKGGIVFGAVVWAELCTSPMAEERLWDLFAWLRPVREPFPFRAAFLAGQAHRLYRQRGGRRERTLPDFLIGAHASAGGHRLLTRDPARYRTYFPDLDILSPETAP